MSAPTANKIESVPRNTYVLVYSPWEDWVIAKTDGEDWRDRHGLYDDGDPGFTHWLPLPNNPTDPPSCGDCRGDEPPAT